MIKHLFIFILLASAFQKTFAQKHGNEWINYSQKHYRINIPKTGLYRIDSITLANAGIPLATINPKNFQLFIKGDEQYLYINGENDGVFNNGDYIEFYAEKNDGRFDSLAYSDITRLPNPYYALFNDTNYAFLTWNSSLMNKRVVEETDVNFTGYTPADYYYTERLLAGNNYYSTGQVFVENISDSRYIKGEGYGYGVTQGANIQSWGPSLNVYQNPLLPVYIKTAFSGASEDYPSCGFDHQVTIQFNDNNNNTVTLFDTTFLGYKQFNIAKQITSDQLQNSSVVVVNNVNNPCFSGLNTRLNIHYLSLTYPQLTDFQGLNEKIVYINDDANFSKTYLDINNVSAGGNPVIIYDLTNHRYLPSVVNSNNVKLLIPNNGNIKKCYITASSNTMAVSSMYPVNQTGYFVNYYTANPDSAYLIVSHAGLQTLANNYKLHRESASGGSNHVILAMIEDLYDQFAYGNQKNPLAIKNFCRFLSDSLAAPPKYLLLLGKSIKNDLVKTNAVYWNDCKVPTFGVPASDNLFTCGIKGMNSSTPFIPTGRVSAKNTTEGSWYLNKVIAHETYLPNHEEWHKRVLHFAGGYDPMQQNLFTAYLNTYSVTIADTSFGGNVYTFKKTSTAPIQINISDSVKQLIDEGASIITFFGHASLYGFDQAIDNPSSYNNKDKYPLLIANSCYSGDIHTPASASTSEAFTFIDEKGTIGFIASSSIGIANTLHLYTSELYKSLASETYLKGVGDAIKNACLKNSQVSNQLQEITALEMTLEGDPYIRIAAFAKPDYEIKNQYVSFNTNLHVDSIGVNIRVKNLGRAKYDTIVVRLRRFLPSGDTTTYFKSFNAPLNNDTLSFSVLKDYNKGVGLNKFQVYVDFYNEVDELLETNNSTTGTVDLFIPGGDVVPVYPYKYAIVPNTPTITLKASTADPFAPTANYKIQLDTNDTFQNPINSTIVSSSGGVIEWTVSLPFADSTVYFWRISKDSILPTDSYLWRESSFQVIGNKTGWAQAHFHQFKNDYYQFIKYKKPQRQFDFFNDYISLKCQNGYSNVLAFSDIQYSLNNSLKATWHFAFNGWTIAVFDKVTGQPWDTRINGTAGYASPYNNCLAFSDQTFWAFDFGPTTYCGSPTATWQNDLMTLINSAPDSSWVLAYSSDSHNAQTYSTPMYNAFESFGSSQIHTALDTVPMIIFGKKGRPPGSAHEVVGVNKRSVLNLEDSMITNWNSGHIVSELIGPSSKWKSLHWKYTSQSASNDTVILKILRYNQLGQADTVPAISLTNTTFDLYNLDTHIDAVQYPYIKLVALMKDNVLHKAPQMKKWQVIYDEAAECAINAKKGLVISNDSIDEGDKLFVKLPIENIGQIPFNDSLIVTYWLEDNLGVPHQLPQKLKAKPFVPAQIIYDTIMFNSYQYPGLNYLWIDVNTPGHIKYQIEQHHFNNIARIPFRVNTDKINPLLDVTFDGTHILNGDIVSAKPFVLVSLKDENKFLALNDSSNFAVYLRYPGQSTEKRLYFANDLHFTPAQLPNNSCKIEWKPELAIDGKYTLLVQATDRSKNASGSVDYSIQFEIENKETVTEVLNYPNPFSTSTRFVFTLTGSEVPDIFTIQIITITGKVVREIKKEELGNIRIGRNITSYAWDGKDEFGDKLANGVYLYRVITRHDGKAVEKRESEADSFFKKGWGKLVIMR